MRKMLSKVLSLIVCIVVFEDHPTNHRELLITTCLEGNTHRLAM